MKVYFVRHGFAGPRKTTSSADDARPLVKEGIDFVTALADKMESSADRPLIIFTSPIQRCLDTAQILSDELKNNPPVKKVDWLANDQDTDDVVKAIWKNVLDPRAKRAMLVTHSEILLPVLAQMNDASKDDVQQFVMGEIRRMKVDTATGYWMERWKMKPSDVGPFTNYL